MYKFTVTLPEAGCKSMISENIAVDKVHKVNGAVADFCIKNKIVGDYTKDIVPFIIFGTSDKFGATLDGRTVLVTVKERGRARLATAFIEVCEDGDIYPWIEVNGTPEQALRTIRNQIETEENERGFDAGVDWAALLDDICLGNQSSGPYAIDPDGCSSKFYVSARIVEF